MCIRHASFGLMVFLFSVNTVTAQEEARHKDHEALRTLLKTAAEALNTRDFDTIAPLLHPDFTIITVDNQKLTGLNAFERYWNRLFSGEGTVLERIEVNPEADELTRFLDENTGVSHGTSRDTYYFTNGDVRTMKTRWTAVVQKQEGPWKLVAVHFSANLLDNPVLEATRSQTLKIAGSALIGGLVLGIAITLIARRRKNR